MDQLQFWRESSRVNKHVNIPSRTARKERVVKTDEGGQNTEKLFRSTRSVAYVVDVNATDVVVAQAETEPSKQGTGA